MTCDNIDQFKLCILDKIFEKIVIDDLSIYYCNLSLITDCYLCCDTASSEAKVLVNTNLLLFTDFLLNALNAGHQMDMEWMKMYRSTLIK